MMSTAGDDAVATTVKTLTQVLTNPATPKQTSINVNANINSKGPHSHGSKLPPGTRPLPARRGPTGLSKNRGTGFEEYYADPPMTPEEAREEREDLYSLDKPFSERIITAIGRYRGRRRLTGTLTRYFNEYLSLGGIDSSQAAFQSRNNPSAAESRDILQPVLGKTNIRWWTPGDSGWTVDFAGVASGYFSRILPNIVCERERDGVMKGVQMVDNFLRYLLMHDVCNEYKTDIEEGLEICKRAETEVPMVLEAQRRFPGVWNALVEAVADEERTETPALYNPKDPELTPYLEAQTGRSLPAFFKATDYLNLCLALHNKEPPMDLSVLAITRTSSHHLQILSIEPIPSENLTVQTPAGPVTYPPLGRVSFKHIHQENGLDRGDYVLSLGIPDTVETFLLDVDICERLLVGMKTEVLVGTLRNGVRFVRVLKELWPEFHVFLAQELMKEYKKHEISQRLGPTSEDFDRDVESGECGQLGKDELIVVPGDVVEEAI